jgi:hypothetical protein
MDVEETQKDQNVTCAFCGNEFKAKAYESQEEKYNKAVTNLWIAVGLSIVNLVLILAGSSWNFAFSLWGSEILCELGSIGVVFAVLLLIVYGVLAFLSKSNKATFIAAFVLVCIDTLVGGFVYIMALMGDNGTDIAVSAIIGFIFHGWLLWEMGKGLAACKVTSK